MQMLMIVSLSSLKERVHKLLHQCGVKAFTGLNETVRHGKDRNRLFKAQTTLSASMIVGQLCEICSYLASGPEQGPKSFGRKQQEISTYRRVQVQGAMASRLL